jgi:hypothetical protein
MGPEAWASLSCGEQQGVKRTCNAKLSFCLLADWGLQVKPSASPSRVLQMILYGSMNQVKASWTHEAEAAWKVLGSKTKTPKERDEFAPERPKAHPCDLGAASGSDLWPSALWCQLENGERSCGCPRTPPGDTPHVTGTPAPTPPRASATAFLSPVRHHAK